MRDFYPEDMLLRNRIFDAWRQAARRYGFLPYDACVVESLDLLKRKAGEEIVNQIYGFQDKSGRDLALRPEMTPTLARMVAARQGALAMPIKWFAIAQCFRYERMTRGRKREHYQWNLDIVGEKAVTAEAEVIACAAAALRTMGLSTADFRIHFSNRALLGDLLARLGIAPSHHAPAFLALDKRGKISDDEIRSLLAEEGLDTATTQRVFDILGVASLDDAAALLDGETDALTRVRDFMKTIDAYGLTGCVQFDLSVIRGLSYYTGIVFEAFDTARKFRAIFGGGRYDHLLGDVGGTPETAVGLGFGDVVVAEILTDRQAGAAMDDPADLAVGYMQETQRDCATRVAESFRKTGHRVDLGLSPEKPRRFFSRTGDGQFKEAVYNGPDDLASGQIRVKSLNTREERVIVLSDLLGA